MRSCLTLAGRLCDLRAGTDAGVSVLVGIVVSCAMLRMSARRATEGSTKETVRIRGAGMSFNLEGECMEDCTEKLVELAELDVSASLKSISVNSSSEMIEW